MDGIASKLKEKNMMPTYSTSNAKTEKPCHSGLYNVGNIGKAKIWIGRETAVVRKIPGAAAPVRLIVNCCYDAHWTKLPVERHTVAGNPGAHDLLGEKLFIKEPPVPQIGVDWPDFGVPEIGKSWWVRLNAALSKIDGDVIFHCVGGHGRSGTALSILAALNGWCGPDKCPVTWLRQVYCKNVVESVEQLEYIEAMIGRLIPAEPSKFWSNATQATSVPFEKAPTCPPMKQPTMSLRKYAKFLRSKAGKAMAKGPAKDNIPSVKELKSRKIRTIVIVGGDWFQFDPDTGKFTFLPE